MKKKGVSPVIATVLLVSMVVVLGLIVFLWFKGMTAEAITKFGGTNIELVCGDVAFDASYSSGKLYLSNTGNVPIFGMKIKTSSLGSSETIDIRDYEEWEAGGLDLGDSKEIAISDIAGSEKLILVPVLLGNSDSGKKTFVCSESQYGKGVSL
ncbi:hypothetical protein K9L16_03270 [Candidatus Pacearchaeota archaeon]|nr:hypothetical protein [Candidatus Pacearchaeota archaeon]